MGSHFHDMVIYQVYPKSFYDSDGDGVGDLRGIIEKVPYIASLGVDMVWFNPFYPSPQRDNGYDVSDYTSIDPAMGSMKDFEELVAALAQHDIGVMLDMVLNHVSTQHEWFQKALAGDREYQDFFIIRPPAADGGLPNNWESKFGGAAWAPFGDTGNYYLHLFDVTQADLNWRNPRVREEMANVVNFWASKGVHGFRFDVINLIGKDDKLASSPAGVDPRVMYTDGADVDKYLRELRGNSFGADPDSVTVGEMSSTSIERCVGYTNPANEALDMVFNFHHLKVDYPGGKKWTLAPFDFAELKRLFHAWSGGMQDGNGWSALFWNNHDQPRALDRFGDVEKYRTESATMLATAIHAMRGTPFIYMGEEIGMVDPTYSSIADYVDVEACNAYQELVAGGMSKPEAFATVHSKARDNARTPMPWDSSAHAGFTKGTPWLRPTSYDGSDGFTINVEEEQNGAILPFYRRLIALRKLLPAISVGRVDPWAPAHDRVYGYVRSLAGDVSGSAGDGADTAGAAITNLCVLTNFYGEATEVAIPENLQKGYVILDNYRAETYRAASNPQQALEMEIPQLQLADEASVTLKPYQAVIIANQPLG